MKSSACLRSAAHPHARMAFTRAGCRIRNRRCWRCASKVYQREFGALAHTQVIHAGLECGVIGAKYPGLDIISFGPTIHNPHAPGESVEIDSVAKSWHLLKAILAALRLIRPEKDKPRTSSVETAGLGGPMRNGIRRYPALSPPSRQDGPGAVV